MILGALTPHEAENLIISVDSPHNVIKAKIHPETE